MVKKKKHLYQIATCILLIVLILSACRPSDISDNKLYTVDEDSNEDIANTKDNLNERELFDGQIQSQGIDAFIKDKKMEDIYIKFHALIGNISSKGNRVIPLTISKDGSTMFAMECISDDITDFMKWMLSSSNERLTIKGESKNRVNLLKLDLEKREVKNVADNIDFIYLAKWNNDHSMVAFLNGDQLLVYDLEGKKLLFKDIKDDRTTYFSWSFDGEKIYTEGINLINDSIYYVDSEKLVKAYETKEDLYYKGRLDDNYYFATLQEKNEMKLKYGNGSEYATVIVDKDENIRKILSGGRFRGAFKRAFLQVGESGFGLSYYPDIEKLDEGKVLTDEYIYDAKFVTGGKIAYIIEDKNDILENNFILYIVDKNGNEINNFKISSTKIAVTPDGIYGTIKGDYWRTIDFKSCTSLDIISEESNGQKEPVPISEEEKSLKEIFKTIRGGMDAYLKFEINGEKDYEAIKKYFVNHKELKQAAAYDMEFMFNDIEKSRANTDDNYSISLYMERGSKWYIDDKRATMQVYGIISNASGTGMAMKNSLELIKKDDKWYIMGFSTFPYSKKSKNVSKLVDKYVGQIKRGELFPEKGLKDKDIDIIQIQFWQMSMPHLASDIDYANYSKVYLAVKENGKEIIYKMVLDNRTHRNWKPIQLTKERVSTLF